MSTPERNFPWPDPSLERVRDARLASARAWSDFSAAPMPAAPAGMVVTVLHPDTVLSGPASLNASALLLRPLHRYGKGDHVVYRLSRRRACLATLHAAWFVLVRPAMWRSIAQDRNVWRYTRKYFRRAQYVAVGCL
ncbi:hypothetical protein [Burkholderia gladioli]|uniref:hypothetical protein n=1 Tax=Burkholderia gladioli TaxID=28095 RepID=UPI00163F8463|nr:hypothetical protein [Burkholderia gladioli]